MLSKQMTLSIIIVSFNTKDLLDRCLSSIFQSLQHVKLDTEVLVIDNNSIDGSVELLKKKYPQVVCVLNKENIGYGKANNQGIEKAKGEYILLLNSDCEVKDDAILQLLSVVKVKPKAFVGGKLYNEDGTSQQSCGPFYSLPVVFLMLFTKGDQLNISRYSPDYEREVDWVSGACIMTRKKDIQDVGGFDESIFMYMEEIDLLQRAKHMGFTVWFTPKGRFLHTGAASAVHKKEPVINIYSGLLYYYKKHRSQFEYRILTMMLRLKAWLVIIICGIMRDRDLSAVYGKALAILD